ncbi:MAG: UvrD-helicase domain-containing protein [Candidatus Neomarinimicrobiota bacterium]|jgi:DNA helicase-2/ATP-dependent DNA helicase PcrA|nr:UvrD-helicase domain-containing protein [Candidatus Neomarinimicrobiota bacterium]MDD3965788.1 UvrD-helicase domain-containing protein [Candidatus Neomarinimicrobiota bacterium]MDX9780251.1 UvrD-helicase domain-containing protein [bacterium]
MHDIFAGLNDRQREAVLATEGPVLIFAGAGSGKTRVLTRKIAWLLQQKKTTANRILAVTFTNKAANEMKERVNKLLGQVNYVNIGTFHSIGARILRSERDNPEFPADFTIYDTGDTRALITKCLKDMDIDPKTLRPSAISHYISQQKQQILRPQNVGKKGGSDYLQEKLMEIYGNYETCLRDNNACDFDDLLMRPILLFRAYPAVAEKYRHRWDYVLVDEYQDTNPAQFELLTFFSEKHHNICVVGDDDQSIYGWRGADIRNILEFEKHFPDARIIKLEQNYRSTKTIIEAASAMIKGNRERADKNLWTEAGQGEKILHKVCENDYEEAHYIAGTILRSGMDLRDAAILYRTNAQSRLLEEALRNRGIRYVLVGGVKFYERKEIKDILAYLNVLVNPRDTVNLKRIINVPGRGIGDTSIARLERFAAETRRTLWESLQYPQEAGLHKNARQQLGDFMAMMLELQSQLQLLGSSDLAMEVLEKSGINALYDNEKDPEQKERRRNLAEFINGVAQFEKFNPGATISDFLHDVSLQSDIDQWEDSSDAVTLMTVHSAKGLEFRQVFIAGMEEGLFPLERTRLAPKEMEEERRLFYVALTRAKERVFITSAEQRMRYGQLLGAEVSEFIFEIPAHCLKTEKPAKRRPERYGGRSRAFTAGSFRAEKEERPGAAAETLRPAAPGTLKIGDRVKHLMFGKGRVRSVLNTAGQVFLHIDFDSGERKTIAEKFIERIG